MLYLQLIILLFLCSCSKSDGPDDYGSVILPPSDPIVKREESSRPILEDIELFKLKSFHQLSIQSDDQSLFTRSNVPILGNMLYEKLLENYMDKNNFSFHESLHHYKVWQFMDEERKLVTPKYPCQLDVSAKVAIPDSLNKKILAPKIRLSFVIQLANNQNITLPAELKSSSFQLRDGDLVSIRALRLMNVSTCRSLIKNRGRLNLKIEEVELAGGEDYFSSLEKRHDGRTVYSVSEQDIQKLFSVDNQFDESELETNDFIPLSDGELWHTFHDQSGVHIFKATRHQLEKGSLRWNYLKKQVRTPMTLELKADHQEISFYLKGVMARPEVMEVEKIDHEMFTQFKADSPIYFKDIPVMKKTCSKVERLFHYPEREINTIKQWRQVPISIESIGYNGQLWDLPGIQYQFLKDNTLALKINPAFIKADHFLLKLETESRQTESEFNPLLVRDFQFGCDEGSEDPLWNKAIKPTKSHYLTEIYYR